MMQYRRKPRAFPNTTSSAPLKGWVLGKVRGKPRAFPNTAGSVILVLAAALIYWGESPAVDGIKSAAVRSLGPLMEGAEGLRFGVRAAFDGETEEVRQKQRDADRLKAALFEIETLKIENAELRRALDLKEDSGLQLKAARVRLWSKTLGEEFLIIDQGKEKGISEGSIVLNSDGVVIGVVKESGRRFSKVSVASNPGLSFEVTIVPPGVKALAKGIGGRAFSLELIPTNVEIRRGDFAALYTEKSDRPLLLGEIVSIGRRAGTAFKEAQAVLVARPEEERNIFIIPR